MWYFILVISILYIGFFIWATIDYNKKQKMMEKELDKFVYRSDESVEEYGKKMNSPDTPSRPEPEE